MQSSASHDAGAIPPLALAAKCRLSFYYRNFGNSWLFLFIMHIDILSFIAFHAISTFSFHKMPTTTMFAIIKI